MSSSSEKYDHVPHGVHPPASIARAVIFCTLWSALALTKVILKKFVYSKYNLGHPLFVLLPTSVVTFGIYYVLAIANWAGIPGLARFPMEVPTPKKIWDLKTASLVHVFYLWLIEVLIKRLGILLLDSSLALTLLFTAVESVYILHTHPGKFQWTSIGIISASFAFVMFDPKMNYTNCLLGVAASGILGFEQVLSSKELHHVGFNANVLLLYETIWTLLLVTPLCLVLGYIPTSLDEIAQDTSVLWLFFQLGALSTALHTAAYWAQIVPIDFGNFPPR